MNSIKRDGINIYSDLVLTLKEIFPELVQPKADLPAYIAAKTERERVQAAAAALFGTQDNGLEYIGQMTPNGFLKAKGGE